MYVQKFRDSFSRLHILLEFLEAHHPTRKPQEKVTVTPIRVTETSRPEALTRTPFESWLSFGFQL